MKRLAPIIAVASLWSQSALAAEPLMLAPSSDWVLDYADESCALQRQFGGEGETVFLEMRQFEPLTYLQFSLASPDFERRPGPVEMAVLPHNVDGWSIDAIDMSFGGGGDGKLFMGQLHSDTPGIAHIGRAFLADTTS